MSKILYIGRGIAASSNDCEYTMRILDMLDRFNVTDADLKEYVAFIDKYRIEWDW